MDIAALDLTAAAESGFDVNLRHPINEEPMEHDGERMYIRVMGKDSAKWGRVLSRLQRDFSSKKGKDSYEETQKRTCDVLAECTIKGRLFLEGKWVNVTPDNAADIYSRFKWIREQVDVDMADRQNLVLDAKKK